MKKKQVYEYGKVGRYFVLYFDIQGVRDLTFEGIDKYSDKTTPEKQKEIDLLSESLRTMLDAFVGMECFIKGKPEEYRDYLTNGDVRIDAKQNERVLNEIKNVSMGVQQFSDSTLIYVRDTGNTSHVLFEQCMARCAYELIKVMGKGIYVRGAMAYGTGWEIAPNCLFGPVIQEVYEIEQKIANTFRIVVTPHFYEFARNELASLYSCGADRNKPYPFKMIARDPDGVLIFDYLSDVAIENMIRFEQNHSAAFKNAGEHICKAYNRIVKRHKELLGKVDNNQKNSRLVVKYAMYMSYLESRFCNFEKYGARFVKGKEEDVK